MFEIKFVRYPVLITYLHHTYLITTFKILSADISDIGIFLLPDIGIGIDHQNPISIGPYILPLEIVFYSTYVWIKLKTVNALLKSKKKEMHLSSLRHSKWSAMSMLTKSIYMPPAHFCILWEYIRSNLDPVCGVRQGWSHLSACTEGCSLAVFAPNCVHALWWLIDCWEIFGE